VGFCGGGGAPRSLTAKTSRSTAKDGGGDPPQELISNLFSASNEPSFDVIYETREEINRYVYEPEKVKTILPHLIIDENFGRPKTYRKTKT